MKIIAIFMVFIVKLFADGVYEEVSEKIVEIKKDKLYSIFVEGGIVKLLNLIVAIMQLKIIPFHSFWELLV